MRNNAGFTLIELVIVIVILGILGAVASVKFVQLQGDAYRANLNALNSSIESAITLARAKAMLGGYDNDGNPTATDEIAGVVFAKGYPTAEKSGIISMLSNTETFLDRNFNETVNQPYVYKTVHPNGFATLIIAPGKRGMRTLETPVAQKCQLEYKQSNAVNIPPTISVFGDGC